MKIYDISVAVPDAPAYPGDPEASLRRVRSMENGDVCNLTEVHMCVHSGTHADSPLHFIDGEPSIDLTDPALFCGKARVVTVYKKTGQIEREDLEPIEVKKGERILFKTRNSLDGHIGDRVFYGNFCALSLGAAEYLSERGAVLVGIDYASIGAGEATAPTHRIILGARIAVLEWLDLRGVDDGEYFLTAAPLKFAGAEGAPVRALLFEGL